MLHYSRRLSHQGKTIRASSVGISKLGPPGLDSFTSYNCKCKVKKGGKIGMEFGREMGKGLAIIG